MEKVHWRDLSASLLVFTTGVVFLVWALTYERSAAEVPALVALLTIALSIMDTLTFTNTNVGQLLRRIFASDRTIEWQAEGSENTDHKHIASAVISVLVYVFGLIIVGFNVMTPLYVFLYLRIHARKSLKVSTLAAILTTAATFVLFRILLDYPLFEGIVFGGKL